MSNRYWFCEINSLKQPVQRFLCLLLSFFMDAECFFNNLLKNCFSFSMGEEHLRKIIEQDFIKLFLPLISRVCVYEMHVLSKQGSLKGKTSKDRFDHFIYLLSTKKISQAILNKYSVLNRLIYQRFDNYLIHRGALLQRLENDHADICQALLSEPNFLTLTNIQMCGDSHNGQNVSILTFKQDEKQRKIVYKPRALTIDAAFQKLIHWFNAHLDDINLICPRILLREEYGWCEYIEYLSCQKIDQIHLFYQRIGGLLCISYLLGSSDLHAENIIAHGDHPVIIDYECSLRPITYHEKEMLRHLVSYSFLLPCRYLVNDHYPGIDMSGISGFGNEEMPYQCVDWENAGTDQMRLIRKKVLSAENCNIPLLNGNHVQPRDYEQDVIIGFKKFYHLILDKKDTFLSKNSPLDCFDKATIRIVFKETHIYQKLISESFHPVLLRDFNQYQEHFFWLKKLNNDKSVENLFASEMIDLLNADIPYFSCIADGHDIFDSQKKVLPRKISISALGRIRYYLLSFFDEHDFDIQCEIIRNSFSELRELRSLYV